jgi:hypothetical protein
VEQGRQSFQDVLPDATEDEQRRLEWAGIHSAQQLRDLQRLQGEEAVARVAQIPILRLRQALERASRPLIRSIAPEQLGNGSDGDGATLLRIRGSNLMQAGAPAVRIGSEQMPVLRATEQELVVAPLPHQLSGLLAVEPTPGKTAHKEFDCRLPAQAAPTPVAETGGAP